MQNLVKGNLQIVCTETYFYSFCRSGSKRQGHLWDRVCWQQFWQHLSPPSCLWICRASETWPVLADLVFPSLKSREVTQAFQPLCRWPGRLCQLERFPHIWHLQPKEGKLFGTARLCLSKKVHLILNGPYYNCIFYNDVLIDLDNVVFLVPIYDHNQKLAFQHQDQVCRRQWWMMVHNVIRLTCSWICG